MMHLRTVTFATILTVVTALQQQQPQTEHHKYAQPALQKNQAVPGYDSSVQNSQDLKNITAPLDTLLQTVQNQHDELMRLSQDKQEIIQFLNTKNIIKTIFRLFLGTSDETLATSRQVLNIFVKMLELLKSKFGQRARSSSTSRVRDALDGAAMAGLSMFQGYVKSVISKDQNCIQRNICESAASATKESRDLGTFIANLGGYAASSMLEMQLSMPFSASFEASRLGRTGTDCRRMYRSCSE